MSMIVESLQVQARPGTAGIAGPRAYVQVRINTTDYFLDPDNIPNDGIPGAASPYPRSINFQPCFNLYPDVYVLPGQTFQILYTAETATGVGVAATSTEGTVTTCTSTTATLECSGFSTPKTGHVPFFYITCGISLVLFIAMWMMNRNLKKSSVSKSVVETEMTKTNIQ